METINEINTAITEGKTGELIEPIFQRLEQYVVEHFSAEEVLMEQCNYRGLERHKLQHQKFFEKIPQLRNKLLTANSMEVAMEVSLFLSSWLMNHVIMEDISYAQPASAAGLSDHSEQSEQPLQGLLNWAISAIPLRRRIHLGALVPITGLLLLISTTLFDHYQESSRIQQLLGLSNLAADINLVSHRLQAERGLSTAFISSGYQHFESALQEQRSKTNRATTRYLGSVQQLSPQLSSELLQMQQTARKRIAQLSQQRIQTDQQRHTIAAMQSYYTDTIHALLAIYHAMTGLTQDQQLSGHIQSISALVQMKEANGLKRAQGTAILQGELSPTVGLQLLSKLIGEHTAYQRIFSNSADRQQQQRWLALSSSSPHVDAKAAEQVLLRYLSENTSQQPFAADHWFALMSERMDQTESFIEQVLHDIELRARQLADESRQQLLLSTLLWLLLLLFTSVLSWLLSRSVIEPIHHLTEGMELLSQGDRGTRFCQLFARDELRKLYAVYESSRRNLLKSDISINMQLLKQEFTYDLSERQRDAYAELASTDSLTGAINRRKFLELAERELLRARRQQTILCCLMLDIDHFKRVNDEYGHDVGDKVLQSFFQTCYRTVRECDLVARIGGEEFVVLLTNSDRTSALSLAERIRSEVERLQIAVSAQEEITITVSIGLCCQLITSQNIEMLIKEADNALYAAKHQGRNRVVVCSTTE